MAASTRKIRCITKSTVCLRSTAVHVMFLHNDVNGRNFDEIKAKYIFIYLTCLFASVFEENTLPESREYTEHASLI